MLRGKLLKVTERDQGEREAGDGISFADTKQCLLGIVAWIFGKYKSGTIWPIWLQNMKDEKREGKVTADE